MKTISRARRHHPNARRSRIAAHVRGCCEHDRCVSRAAARRFSTSDRQQKDPGLDSHNIRRLRLMSSPLLKRAENSQIENSQTRNLFLRRVSIGTRGRRRLARGRHHRITASAKRYSSRQARSQASNGPACRDGRRRQEAATIRY